MDREMGSLCITDQSDLSTELLDLLLRTSRTLQRLRTYTIYEVRVVPLLFKRNSVLNPAGVMFSREDLLLKNPVATTLLKIGLCCTRMGCCVFVFRVEGK